MALGNQAYQQVLSKSKLSHRKDWNEVLQRVGKRISQAANRPQFRWQFSLIDSPEKNAFCLPGGKVAVYTGILPILKNEAETAFRSAHLVAWALIAGSVVFVAAEYFSKKLESYQTLDRMSVGQGIVIGLFQCLALVPGMSRSGMTISGGLFLGFTRSDAARFGFLLSVPILFGTGLKKLYDLGADGFLVSSGEGLVIGSVVAFISGLLAIHILMVLVRKTPLTVFAAYRVALALAILVYI